MVQKIPPPPPIAKLDPTFNRWLLELIAILNSSGGIDPGSVAGLIALTAQVTTNTASIVVINGEITTINGQITVINGEITTINGEIAVLQANHVLHNGSGAPAAGLGSPGDWYGDIAGVVGARVWIKTAVATWTPFPF
jgi:hypothetical protein